MQQRPGRGFLPERAVAVPQLIGLPVLPARIVVGEKIAVFVQIGNVEDFRKFYAQPHHAALALVHDGGSIFQRPVEPRKRDLPLVVDILVRQHADRILVHRLLDGVARRKIDVAAEIGAPDLGGKKRMQLCDGEIHGAFPAEIKFPCCHSSLAAWQNRQAMR